MDKFYIITNNDKDKDFQITNEIVSYLKKNGKKCQVQQAERKLEGACHCIFNDLRVTRDHEGVESTWKRISDNRKNKMTYDQTGDVVRYAGDILDYMEIANLLKTYDSRTYYLNTLEEESIIKFCASCCKSCLMESII